MRKLTVVAAVHTAQTLNRTTRCTTIGCTSDVIGFSPDYNVSTSEHTGRIGRFQTDLHGHVNILLGGAMLGGVIMVVVLVCYCCHRNVRKQRPREYSRYWRAEPDIHSLEVFTMDTHGACRERAPLSNQEEITPGIVPYALALAPTLQPQSQPQPQPSSPSPSSPPPPPTYESLIFNPSSLLIEKKDAESPENVSANSEENKNRKIDEKQKDDGLPSYEAALKLEADGYV